MAHDHHHHHHGPEPKLDEGAQALSDALKLMFRVLKFVMFGLIAYFIFSCFSEIEENEKAIVLRFGKIVGSRDAAVHEKGLLFTFFTSILTNLITSFQFLEAALLKA